MAISSYHNNNKVLLEYDLLRNSLQTYIDYLLANYCMPTLLKLKPSCLFRVNKNHIQNTIDFLSYLEEELQAFHSRYTVLYENNQMLVVLIYNKELLIDALTSKEKQSFLQSMGYSCHGIDVNYILNTLKQRYRSFKENNHNIFADRTGSPTKIDEINKSNVEFPHEIGIILGYPVEDVEEFIRNNGKNYLLCGYWKVYHDVNSARLIFDNYKEVRDKAIKCIMSGMKLKDYYMNGGYHD